MHPSPNGPREARSPRLVAPYVLDPEMAGRGDRWNGFEFNRLRGSEADSPFRFFYGRRTLRRTCWLHWIHGKAREQLRGPWSGNASSGCGAATSEWTQGIPTRQQSFVWSSPLPALNRLWDHPRVRAAGRMYGNARVTRQASTGSTSKV
jgi:hypothetical protein